MINCQCEYYDKLSGNEGQNYAKGHLIKVLVDNENWLILYRCPNGNHYWKEYFPRGKQHGGGISEFIRINEQESVSDFQNVFRNTKMENTAEYERLKNIIRKHSFWGKLQRRIGR